MKDKRWNGYMNICKRSKGFTLVELIVVLIIIAILAALAVPALLGFIDNAHKKQVIARGQTALSSTQAALSDIYSSNDNKYTKEKRNQTRLNAGAAESTAFTVWNVRPLYDEYEGTIPATRAIVDEVGSYTVNRAIYKDDDSNYAAYNGSEWEVFETEEEAQAFIALADLASDSIIHVWPFDDDTALMADKDPKDKPKEEEPDASEIVATKTVIFKLHENKRAFFAKNENADIEDDSGEKQVKVEFNLDDMGNVSTEWDINENANSFRRMGLAGIKYVLNFAKTYVFRYWKLEDGDFTATKRYEIENYIFNNEGSVFTFIVYTMRDPDLELVATLDKNIFKNKRINAVFTNIEQVPYDEETFEFAKKKGLKVDDGRTDCEIYSWYDNKVLKWCTDALVAYLPEDCSELFSTKGYPEGIDLSGFDASKVKTMESAFNNCKNLKYVNFGYDFEAINLTNMNECFRNSGNLQTVDMSGVTELGGSLTMEYAFRGLGNLVSIDFGDGFKHTKMSGSWEKLFFKDRKLKTVNMSGWNVIGVESLEKAFYKCESLCLEDGAFSGWDLQNCTTMFYAFYDCGKNSEGHQTDLHELKTGDKLLNIADCFKRTKFRKLNLNGIDVTNVTNMRSTFSYAGLAQGETPFLEELDISEWHPQKIQNLRETFLNCNKLNSIDLSGWNLTNLENMYRTFEGCTNANIILDGWNDPNACPKGGKLHSVKEAFKNCSSMTGTVDFSNWVTTGLNGSYVMDNSHEYDDAELDNIDHKTIYNIDGDMSDMFSGCRSLQRIIMKGWDLSNSKNTGGIFSGCTSLEYLDVSGWTVTRDNFSMKDIFPDTNKPFLKEVFLNGAHFNSITNLSGLLSGYGSLEKVEMNGFTATSALNINNMFSGSKLLNSVEMKGADFSAVVSAQSVFENCESLTKCDLSESVISEITDMSKFFKGCTSIVTIKMSDMQAYKVENMASIFEGCSKLTNVDFKNFNSASLKNISSMFKNCTGLTAVNLDSLNVVSVENMNNMFEGCSKMTSAEMKEWHLDNMGSECKNVFLGCSSLVDVDIAGMHCSALNAKTILSSAKGYVEALNISECVFADNVDMSDFFNGYKRLKEIDLREFDFSKVQKTNKMFAYCYSLEEVKFASNTVFSELVYMNDMFRDCISLTKLNFEDVVTTSKLKEMPQVFMGCVSLEHVYLDKICTEGVYDMTGMFGMYEWVNGKTVDIGKGETISIAKNDIKLKSIRFGSGCNTNSITNGDKFGSMFRQCVNLETIYVDEMDLTNPVKPSKTTFFVGDAKLVGGNGTTYINNNEGNSQAYACIDGKDNKAGYFTKYIAPQ